MSDRCESGILYTEYSRSKTMLPGAASVWSLETRLRELDRRSITRTPEGDHEYWLDRSDPLLNTILPGTGVSVVVHFSTDDQAHMINEFGAFAGSSPTVFLRPRDTDLSKAQLRGGPVSG